MLLELVADRAIDRREEPESRGAWLGEQGKEPLFILADASLAHADRARLIASIEAGASGFQAVFLPEDAQRKCRTINGMARQLHALIENGAPVEVFRFLGIGDAGFLAYELAHLMHAAGHMVAFLGIAGTQVSSLGDGALNRESPLAVALADFVPDAPALQVTLIAGRCVHAEVEAQSWQRLLGEERVSVHWFDLSSADASVAHVSGPSAAAIGAVVRTRLERALCANLDAKEHAYRPLMTIQSGGRGTAPYVCVPGAGASVVDFLPLAASLGDLTPVHALQPRGMDGVLMPFPTVEAAVDAYAPHVFEVMGKGRQVHLVGHSFGGWVALALAQRLIEEGFEVLSLSILDSEAPASSGRLGAEYTRAQALGELVGLLEMAAERSTGLSASDFEGLDLQQQLVLLHQRMVSIGLMPQRSNPKQLMGTVRTFETALRTRFTPMAAYEGKVRMVFVRSVGEAREETALRVSRAAAAWRRWVPNADFRLGTGNHVTLLKSPHVDGVAAWLRDDATNLSGVFPDAATVGSPIKDPLVRNRIAGASY